MTNQIDALKLALEALENNKYLVADHKRHAYVMEYNSIIKKCKEALAQPEQKRPQNCGTGYCSCIECVMEPEQEPVATVISETGNADVSMSWWHEPALPVGTKLYTIPSQRTWVGLTKEEIAEFATWLDDREEEVGWVAPSEIVAYIEAKLKEKNQH